VETVEERVALLEGRMMEQSEMVADIRTTLVRLGDRMDTGFARVDARFERVESRMAADFRWLAGLQITTLAAVITALIGIAVIR